MDKLKEELAHYEHESWSSWMKYLFSKCLIPGDGSLIIPIWAVDRWQRQIDTPYCDLSEPEKQSDRNEIDKFFHLIESQLKERDARIEILTKGLSDYGWELIDEENEHYGYSRGKYGEAARAIIRKLKSQDEGLF